MSRETTSTSGRGAADRVTIVVRPIATPLSLGFCALAVASFVVSGFELSWIDQLTQAHFVGLIVLAFAVPLQLGGCVFGFLARDPAAATGLGVLGGTWFAYGVDRVTATPGTTSPGLGLLLVAAAGVLLVPVAASSTGKPLAALVILAAATRFALSGSYELTGQTQWLQAAGYAGLAVAALALYAALAFELEGAYGRAILPLGRIGRGNDALTGSLDEQLSIIENEPGVRRPL